MYQKMGHTWVLTGPDGRKYTVTEEGHDMIRFLCHERQDGRVGALLPNLWVRETGCGLEGGDIVKDGLPVIGEFPIDIPRLSEYQCDVIISEMITSRQEGAI